MKKHVATLIVVGLLLGVFFWLIITVGCKNQSSFFISCEAVYATIFYYLIIWYLLLVITVTVWLLIAKRINKPFWWGYIIGILVVVTFNYISIFYKNYSYNLTHSRWYKLTALTEFTPKDGRLIIYLTTKNGNGIFRKISIDLDGGNLRELGDISENQIDNKTAIGYVPGKDIKTVTTISNDGEFKAVTTNYSHGVKRNDGPVFSISFDEDKIDIFDKIGKLVFSVKGINQIYRIPVWNKTSRFLLYESSIGIELIDIQKKQRYIIKSCPFELQESSCARDAEWSYD